LKPALDWRKQRTQRVHDPGDNDGGRCLSQGVQASPEGRVCARRSAGGHGRAGLGAEQAGRVCGAGRHGRRCRPDGPVHPGRGRQEQVDGPAHHRFLDVKGDKGNPHKIIITLSNLFTTPLATGVPFNWRDLTPVQMLALDQFVLWVNEESPHKTAKAFFEAVKAGPPNTFKMGGTGSKQEDQIITVMLEKAAGKKMTYIPFKGGGDVAVQLVGNHISSTVNNPIEAESHWRAGKLRALCVMDKQAMPYKTKLTATQSWADVPTCASAGIPVDYVMLRGIFMAPGVAPDQVAFYLDLFKKVRALPEWKEFMDKGAFNQTALTGQEFFDWLGKNEQMHRTLMKDAGFIAN
jgi:putative tricarboxylic transport membrane protein